MMEIVQIGGIEIELLSGGRTRDVEFCGAGFRGASQAIANTLTTHSPQVQQIDGLPANRDLMQSTYSHQSGLMACTHRDGVSFLQACVLV